VSRLKVFLLGRFEVELEGAPIPNGAWRRRRAADLMKLMALAPSHAMTRERVMDALWPDAAPEQSANNVHRALYDLRVVLGGPFVYPDKGVIRLRDAWVDVDELNALCDRGDPPSLAAATALYRGDLCPDDPYSAHLDAPRRAARQRFVDASLLLAHHRLASADPANAARTARLLLQIDPGNEEAQRLLTRIATPATPPRRPAETDAARAARRLLGGSRVPPMRGRTAELDTLASFIASTGGVLFVTGEAGVGKTRLAVEGARLAVERGAVVMTGAALEAHAGAPYGPFIEMWSDRARVDERAPGDHPFAVLLREREDDPHGERLRLFLAVERSLDAIAGDRGALLVVDDLQLADESSLELTHHLARASRTRVLHLICTCRDEALRPGTAVHHLFVKLHRDRLMAHLSLDRLDAAATREQLEDLLGRERASVGAPAIFALGNGNPFFTEELAAAQRDEPSGTTGTLAVPPGLAAMVRERVAALGSDVETLLAAASISGDRFDFEEVTAVAGLTVERALTALEKAQQDHLLEEEDPWYRFRHALTRQAVYGALTGARRQHLHREIAEWLERHGAAPERVAHQFRSAGAVDRALPYLIAAGRRAAERSGLHETAMFFGDALAALDGIGRPADPERFAIEIELGRIHLALGDFGQAARHHDAAAVVAPDAGARADAYRGAATALIVSGHLADAGARLDAALTSIGGPAVDHPAMIRLLQSRALLDWCKGQFSDAKARALESFEAASRRGDRDGEIRASELLVLCSHGLGEWHEGIAWEERRAAMSGARLDVGELFDIHLCFWDMFMGDPAGRSRVRECLSETEAEAQRLGALRVLALCRCVGGTLAHIEERAHEAERLLREAAELFHRASIASGEASSLVRLGTVLTGQRRFDEARTVLQDGLFVAERATMRSHVVVRLHAAIAQNYLTSGERDLARAAVHEGFIAEERVGRCMGCRRFLVSVADALGQ
jgi:tetratricopeptide (TPR) repeat protein